MHFVWCSNTYHDSSTRSRRCHVPAPELQQHIATISIHDISTEHDAKAYLVDTTDVPIEGSRALPIWLICRTNNKSPNKLASTKYSNSAISSCSESPLSHDNPRDSLRKTRASTAVTSPNRLLLSRHLLAATTRSQTKPTMQELPNIQLPV